jgi:hypothetical protein
MSSLQSLARSGGGTHTVTFVRPQQAERHWRSAALVAFIRHALDFAADMQAEPFHSPAEWREEMENLERRAAEIANWMQEVRLQSWFTGSPSQRRLAIQEARADADRRP